MKKIIYTAILIFICINAISSKNENIKSKWQSKLNSLKVFIENKGQFSKSVNSDEVILYGYLGSTEKYYFTKKGVLIKIDKFSKKNNLLTFIKKTFDNASEKDDNENISHKTYFVKANWLQANNDVTVTAEDISDGYYTFNKDQYKASGFKKLTYRNIYPGIDIEYIIPKDSTGIKYSLIIHPGADASQIKLEYSGDVKDILIDETGNLLIITPAWNLMEHVPFSHYASENQKIQSKFSINKRIISFSFPAGFNSEKILIIDPWMSGISISSNDVGYDVDFDYNNNLYVFVRPIGNTVIYLNKYSVTGTLVWSHLSTYDFTAYEGNFVVKKNTEEVYIGEGYNGSGALLYRLDSTGIADGFVSQQNANFKEIWEIVFDCNFSNNVLALGGGTSGNSNGGRIDLSTGTINVTNFTNISGTCQDIVSYAIDNQNNLFVLYATSSDLTSSEVNNKIELVNSSLTGPVWMVPSGMYGFSEVSNHWPNLSTFSSTSNGFNALINNDNYLFYYDGGGLAAYDKENGNQLAATSVGLTGALYTPLFQGGIATDDCNNLYIGGNNNNLLVYTFDGSSFLQADNMSLEWQTNDQVFDVKYDRNTNLLYVSGENNIGVYSAPYSASCILLTDTSFYTVPDLGTAIVNLNISVFDPSITYIWKDTSGTIIHQTTNSSNLSDTVTGLQSGTYVVTAQLYAPCGQVFTDTVVISDISTNVLQLNRENKQPVLKIYPNPSHENVSIEIINTFDFTTENKNNNELRITDQYGKTINIYKIKENKNITTINIKGWSKGSYLCNLVINNKVIKTEKLIVD